MLAPFHVATRAMNTRQKKMRDFSQSKEELPVRRNLASRRGVFVCARYGLGQLVAFFLFFF